MGSTSEVSSTNTANTNNVLDHTHPYFLHASDLPGMNMVNSCFDGKVYGGWRRCILTVLSAKNKVRFIDGTHSEPTHGSPDLKLWNRSNDME